MKHAPSKCWNLNGLAAVLLAALAWASGGCGSGDGPAAVMDARTLLDRYQKDRLRHDPRHFSEVDLGEFLVAQRQGLSIYYVRFHLYAVVPDRQRSRFEGLLQPRLERVRDAIRETVQSTQLEQLNEPTLDWLKSEMIRGINTSLEARLVRDVVFADYSFERG